MKIGLIVIGKTDAGYFVEAINEYKNRLTHYIPFEMEVIPDMKNVDNHSEAQPIIWCCWMRKGRSLPPYNFLLIWKRKCIRSRNAWYLW